MNMKVCERKSKKVTGVKSERARELVKEREERVSE